MGNNHSFEDIEKKYGPKSVDYIVGKYQERKIYSKIGDEINKLNTQAQNQEHDDLEFIAQQKRKLEQALQQAKNQIETKKKGALQQAEAKHKMKVEQFSGYNDKKTQIQTLEKNIKQKYVTERTKMEEKVKEEVNKHKTGGASTVQKIPEYDGHPDNYRRSIENQCAKKHPDRMKEIDGTELGKKLTWENYKQNFVSILNREQLKRDVEHGSSQIRSNITGGSGAICC